MAYYLQGGAFKEVADIPGDPVQCMGGKIQAAYDFITVL